MWHVCSGHGILVEKAWKAFVRFVQVVRQMAGFVSSRDLAVVTALLFLVVVN